jgi:hypothetical protein
MYFEICEQMGSEPIESEIPVEMDDFPVEIQQVLSIYFKLRDEWDGMSGSYMGKSYAGLGDILDIHGIEKVDKEYVLNWLTIIDRIRSNIIDSQKSKN